MNLQELQARHAKLHGECLAFIQKGDIDSEEYKAVKADKENVVKLIEELKALGDAPDPRQGLPLGGGDNARPSADETKAATLKSINFIRYGADVDEHRDRILTEVYDGNWREKFALQDQGFKAFLRVGGQTDLMDLNLRKAGVKPLWDDGTVIEMLKDGLTVAEIKATMVSGSDALGGYMIPPQRTAQILQELMGLTVVRRAGAYVIRTTSTSIEWVKVTGATTGQYPSALTGAWGGETQSPTSKNLTFGLETITTSLYTYKVAMSQTLLETATNVASILQQKITETLAIDEDIAFLYGDGAQGPRGIMPSGTPDTGITVLTSGTSGTFKIEDLKSLRRQIASAYRMQGRAVYAFNSATGDHIEKMQDGEGRFYFDAVGEDGKPIFGSPSYESEALPDIASLAHPVIYGDMRGYAIVEAGPGLEIFRFRDSNTGPNVTEFHVRRRLGGRVVEPYRLAALKCLT